MRRKQQQHVSHLLDQQYELVDLNSLVPHPDNPNRGAKDRIGESIDVNGFYGAVIAQKSTRRILAGHYRTEQLKERGDTTVPVLWVDVDDDQALRILLADNATGRAGGYDQAALVELLRMTAQGPLGLKGSGFTQGDLAKLAQKLQTGNPDVPNLADRFVVPPFTVLDARQGYWSTRKQQWLALGFNSGSGRGAEGDAAAVDGLVFREGHEPPHVYERKNALEKQLGKTLTWPDFYEACPELAAGHKDSHFDPVLAECCYRWFCPPGGHVLDPFAGEVVKGLVAAALGIPYVGVELRQEQVDANLREYHAVVGRVPAAAAWSTPQWVVGDSAQLSVHAPAEKYRLMFTSPPYWGLERYSETAEDGSTMDYPTFLAWYRQVFHEAVGMLAANSFAVVKVGDVRHPNGAYANLLGDTITCFMDAGLHFYNEAVLITPVGSFATKAARQFQAGRKLTRIHQNVLVFYKGDPSKIKKHYPHLELPGAVPSA